MYEEEQMIKIKFDKNNNRAIALDADNIIGECDFIENEEYWNIIHTEVNKLYQGQGIARKLVDCIVKKSKDCNKNVIAECSYAKKILEKI